MLRNYLVTAWRNLQKNRLFSVLNLAGLSIGLAVSFLILLYVKDELSYDRYNTKADRMARVVFQARINGGRIHESVVMAPLAQAMKKDYPDVEDASRLRTTGAPQITVGEKSFQGEQLAFVDPNFFSLFTLPFEEGVAHTALDQPHTVVLSRELATRLFGGKEALGQLIRLGDEPEPYRVTGILQGVPANSHFRFNLFASMTGLEEARSDSWLSSNFYTYLLLRPGTDLHRLEAKLGGMVEKYMGPQIQQAMGLSLSQFRTRGNELGFALQPLTSIHLHSSTSNELEPAGNPLYVYLFSAVAVFMLLIACINFINLSTASATRRAKEVGVRKVIGGDRTSLVWQFMLESALLVAISLVLCWLLVYLVLPVFNELAGKKLILHVTVLNLAEILGLGIVVTLLAGMYPSLYLASFQPMAVLKGRQTASGRRYGLRAGLVVFQFVLSVGLIIATLVVWQQMNFIRHKNLGYDKQQVLVIPNSYALGEHERTFRQDMLQDPRVLSATISSYKPAGPSSNNNALAYPEGQENQVMKTLEYHVDEQYLPTLGIRLVAGRNFSREFPTDSTAMLINESAARAFGWSPATALGRTVIRQNSDRGVNVPFHVIGVVGDFHFRSLHESISPLLMTLEPDWGLIFRVRMQDIQGLLGSMRKRWESYQPREAFQYAFLDDLYNKTYASEMKTGTILNFFAGLAILVACLGLFGLVTFAAERRTKEVGIRKVLGASLMQVAGLLTAEFLRLVLVACLIAFPLSYLVMNRWLRSFAYRINLNVWVFVLAGLAALFIALFTVGTRAIRAALANPVKNLRSE
ncbi:MAG TPA: ABC transporter permease [Chitinophagaceae bacterium]|nr:ABC transporter permease [Chitinophagaceae bacterium]